MSTLHLIPPPDVSSIQLSEPQRTFVRTGAHAALALGGPGTGKTTVIAETVAHHVEEGTPLERIVVLAASRPQAQELRRLVTSRLGGAGIGGHFTTLYGLALGLLRDEPEDADWVLLRAPQQEQRIRELMAGLPADFWPQGYRRASGTATFARQLREFLARARQLSLDPDDIKAQLGKEPLYAAAARFMEHYHTVLDFEQVLDYSELLLRTRLRLARESVQDSLRARFSVIVADDVQELDAGQMGLLIELSQIGIKLRACADPNQRTGDFRGADAHALTTLETRLQLERVTLPHSFRNHRAITDALAHLSQRLPVTSDCPAPSPAGDGGSVTVYTADNPQLEIAHVADQMHRAHHQEGVPWHEMAVITRAGRVQLAPLVHRLHDLGIPLDVAGDERPISTQHSVQALFDALTAALTPDEPALCLAVLAGPLGMIDAPAQRQLGMLLAGESGLTPETALIQACQHPDQLEQLDHPDAARAVSVVKLLARVRALVEQKATVNDLLWELWEATDWPTRLQQAALAGSRSAHHELDAVMELFELAAREDRLTGASGAFTFMADIMREDIVADRGRENVATARGVRVVTAHRARQGSWRRVWVVGVQEGVWPRGVPWIPLFDPQLLSPKGAQPPAPDHLPSSIAEHVARERRLFYVACARASEHLVITAVDSETNDDLAASRFCQELGVPVQPLPDAPHSAVTPAGLVVELRGIVQDSSHTEPLRRAAAAQLARLSQTPELFPSASPDTWWGSTCPATPPSLNAQRISATQIATLLRCPRQWFLERQLGAQPDSGLAAKHGSLIHHIIEQADQQGWDLPEMQRGLHSVVRKITQQPNARQLNQYMNLQRLLENYATWAEETSGVTLANEHRFQVDAPEAGSGVMLTGTVDRLVQRDNTLVIIDFKTGNASASNETFQHQLGAYLYAADKGAFKDLTRSPVTSVTTELVFLKGKDDASRAHVMREQRNLEEVLQEFHEALGACGELLRGASFPAIRNKSCGMCSVRFSCPAYRESMI